MSQNHDPMVSVVVPCLNRAHYVQGTLDSILRQDYPFIECIVIDGGSTDDTIKILEGYGDRIRWISEPDHGHTDAINKGWWMSIGEILAWLNADDQYVVPDAVTKAVDYLQKNPNVDLVYGDYSYIYPDNRIDTRIIRPHEWDLEYAVTYCTHIIPQPSSFMRRSILEKVGWLDPEFLNCKDHELWLRIGLAGTIRYAPLFLSYGRLDRGISQRPDIGEFKIACNRKFFTLQNVPPLFTSEKFKKKAMSNAYLVGGYYYYVATGNFLNYLVYFKDAFIIDPLNCIIIPRKVFKENVYPVIYFLLRRMLWPEKITMRLVVLPLWIGLIGLAVWLFNKWFGDTATLFLYMVVIGVSLAFVLARAIKVLKERTYALRNG